MNYSNHPATKEYRRLLRRTQTPTERILWKKLRGKQMDGYRFRQQHGFGPYVLDFYCPSLRLCIELDGDVHNNEEVRLKDDERTLFLTQNKIHVLRFRNEEVEQDIDNVMNRIRVFIITSINRLSVVQTPTPLTQGAHEGVQTPNPLT
ncbi:MAG: DUF559 domain-containing protein [Prevotella sp.]|nr:DUF559 domain-containing protein [Prevotella sp.]